MRIGPITTVGLRFRFRFVGSFPAALVVLPSLRKVTEKIIPVCTKTPAAMRQFVLRPPDFLTYEFNLIFVPIRARERAQHRPIDGAEDSSWRGGRIVGAHGSPRFRGG